MRHTTDRLVVTSETPSIPLEFTGVDLTRLSTYLNLY